MESVIFILINSIMFNDIFVIGNEGIINVFYILEKIKSVWNGKWWGNGIFMVIFIW